MFINKNALVYGVRLSGGFDSAVMLYMLAKTITDYNLNTTIQTLTVRRSNPTDLRNYDRADAFHYADQVLTWVKDKFPAVEIQTPLKQEANYWWVSDFVDGQNRSSYLAAQTTLSMYARWRNVQYFKKHNVKPDNKLLYCEYTGTTLNPPTSDVPQSAESHRDTLKQNSLLDSATVANYNSDYAFYEPFRNADKRITVWLADYFKIFDEVTNITKTCEGGPVETNNFSKDCNVCWWCLEKQWAINNFKKAIK